jgi:nucleoside-diphosphate-sugar epimerase
MTPFHLVLGTGPLGLATARALLARGQSVLLVNRRRTISELPEGATILAADLSDAAAMRQAAMRAAVIQFCVQPPYRLWTAEFPKLPRAE